MADSMNQAGSRFWGARDAFGNGTDTFAAKGMNDRVPSNAGMLPLGQRVEVRQREKGLRGSWHPARIIGLKPGRRLVEYDELLTEDRLNKLREFISVGKHLDVYRGAAGDTVDPLPRKCQGFLRPSPPSCTSFPVHSWQRGFFVDVFYQDAWWEAILLEDLIVVGEDSSIKVMYPDEGDTGRVPVRSLRVSQEWDEDTGQWSVKGVCDSVSTMKVQAHLEWQVIDVISSQNPESSSGFSPSHATSVVQDSPLLGRELNEAETDSEKVVHMKGLDLVAEEISSCITKESLYSTQEHADARMMDGGASMRKRLSFCELGEKGPSPTEPVQEAMPRDSGNDGASACEHRHANCSSKFCELLPEKQHEQNDILNEIRVCARKFHLVQGGKSNKKNLDIQLKAKGVQSSPSESGASTESSGEIFRDNANQTESKQRKELCSLSTPLDDSCLQMSMNDNPLPLDCIQNQSNPYAGSCSMKRCGTIDNVIEMSDQEKYELGASQETLERARESEVDIKDMRVCGEEESTDWQQQTVQDMANTVDCSEKSFDKGVDDSLKVGGRLLKRKKGMRVKAGTEEDGYVQGVTSSMDAQLKGKLELGDSSVKIKKKEVKAKDSMDDERSVQDCPVQDENGKASFRESGNSSLIKSKSSSQEEDLQISELKKKVRCIAKVALLEAGFRIEFRPRRNRDSQDLVYVSPWGCTYWSVPKAWRAWKKLHGGGKKSISKYGLNGSALRSRGAKGRDLGVVNAKVGNSRQKHLGGVCSTANSNRDCKVSSSMANQEKLLNFAVKKIGIDLLRALDFTPEQISQLQLTKSELAKLFLEDLGVLNSATKKAKAEMVEASEDIETEKENGNKGDSNPQIKNSKLSAPDRIGERRNKERKESSGFENQSFAINKNPLIGEFLNLQSRHSVNGLLQKKGGGKAVSGLSSQAQREKKRGARQVKGKQAQVDLDIGFMRKTRLKKSQVSWRDNTAVSNDGAIEQEFRSKLRRSSWKNKNAALSEHAIEQKIKTKDNQVSRKVQTAVSDDRSIEQELQLIKNRRFMKDKTAALDATSKKRKTPLSDSVLSHQPRNKKSKVTSKKQTVLSNIRKNHGVLSGCRLQVRPSSSRKGEGTDPLCRENKQTVLSWLFDRGVLAAREKVQFANRENNEIMKEGVATREGILCKCCKKIFTLCDFEAHAGSGLCSSDSNITFVGGRCLLDCKLQAWEIEIQSRKLENYVGVTEEDRNDDTCAMCGDGGDLICCDRCPSTFHASCLQMKDIPEGNWFCSKCCCGVCGGSQYDETGESLDKALVFACSQCEHKYHTSCLHPGGISTDHYWFCGDSCDKIFTALRSLVGISHSLEGGYTWTLLRCMEKDRESQSIQNLEVKTELHSKLAVALIVMQECFVPMVDPRTNIDMIPHVIYNSWSEFNRLNYEGFYTVLLEKGDEIISVASIRVHGARLAEMPLIGTREQYRRQGMCRRLVNTIEKMLSSLGVETLVLPAIPELLETWMMAFGFQPVSFLQRKHFTDLSLMVFPGTQLLEKLLLKSELMESDATFTGVELEKVELATCLSGLTKCKWDSMGHCDCDVCKLKELATVPEENLKHGSHLQGKGMEAILPYEEDIVCNEFMEKGTHCQTGVTYSLSSTVKKEQSVDGIEEMQVRFRKQEQIQDGIKCPNLQQNEDQIFRPNLIDDVVNNQNKLYTQPQKLLDNENSANKEDDVWNDRFVVTTMCSPHQVKSSFAAHSALENLNKDKMSLKGDLFRSEGKLPQESHQLDFTGSPSDGEKKQISTVKTLYSNQLDSIARQLEQGCCCKAAVDEGCDAELAVSAYQYSDSRSELPTEELGRLDLNAEPSMCDPLYSGMLLIDEGMLSVDSLTVNSFEHGRSGQTWGTTMSERANDEQFLDVRWTDKKGDCHSLDGEQLAKSCHNGTNVSADIELIASLRLRTEPVRNAFNLASDEKETSTPVQCTTMFDSEGFLDCQGASYEKKSDFRLLTPNMASGNLQQNVMCMHKERLINEASKFRIFGHSPFMESVSTNEDEQEALLVEEISGGGHCVQFAFSRHSHKLANMEGEDMGCSYFERPTLEPLPNLCRNFRASDYVVLDKVRSSPGRTGCWPPLVRTTGKECLLNEFPSNGKQTPV